MGTLSRKALAAVLEAIGRVGMPWDLSRKALAAVLEAILFTGAFGIGPVDTSCKSLPSSLPCGQLGKTELAPIGKKSRKALAAVLEAMYIHGRVGIGQWYTSYESLPSVVALRAIRKTGG